MLSKRRERARGRKQTLLVKDDGMMVCRVRNGMGQLQIRKVG